MAEDSLRDHLARVLDWQNAHVSFDTAVGDIDPSFRGKQVEGIPYSAWQLIEHMRIAQNDILDFCINPEYKKMSWPDDYWPANPAPHTHHDWDESIARYRADRDALKTLALNKEIDLFAEIPHGTGQTYLRELLLVADHTAYHVGQLVLLRQMLGIW